MFAFAFATQSESAVVVVVVVILDFCSCLSWPVKMRRREQKRDYCFRWELGLLLLDRGEEVEAPSRNNN